MIIHMPHCRAVAVSATAFLLMTSEATAQQVIANVGAEFQNGNTRLSFTIGEPVIATLAAAGAIATQGFQQPPNDFSTAVVQQVDPALTITAFPNPAREQITVMAEGLSGTIDLRLLDASGRLVMVYDNAPARHTLDLAHLSNGCYTILALSDDRSIATIKLTIAR